MGGDKYKAGRWAVREVINKLRRRGSFVKQYVPEDAQIWGNAEYTGRDYIFINNVEYTCPDIEVYKDANMDEIIIRVEVKSFQKYLENLPFRTNDNVFGIKEKLLKAYLRLQTIEEIPCRVVFVLGTDYDVQGFFWETLNNLMDRIEHKEGMYKGTQDGKPELYYFWKVKNLRTDF